MKLLRDMAESFNIIAGAMCDLVSCNDEYERVQRWHDTRNAALTGFITNPSGMGPAKLVLLSAEVADLAHGPLPEDPLS